MLRAALKAEADNYVERHRGEIDEAGHARWCATVAHRPASSRWWQGALEVQMLRVDDSRDEEGHRQRFTSQILPPYLRRSLKVAEVLPIPHLRGLATGDFRPALEGLLGADAAGYRRLTSLG